MVLAQVGSWTKNSCRSHLYNVFMWARHAILSQGPVHKQSKANLSSSQLTRISLAELVFKLFLSSLTLVVKWTQLFSVHNTLNPYMFLLFGQNFSEHCRSLSYRMYKCASVRLKWKCHISPFGPAFACRSHYTTFSNMSLHGHLVLQPCEIW